MLNTPRKQRTAEHILADLAVHHLQGFVLRKGHVVEKISSDYGYDLVMFTFDSEGYIEPDMVLLQVKGRQTWEVVDAEIVFDLSIKDFNLWRAESNPVVLVLYDGGKNQAWWVWIQQYFRLSTTRQPRKGAKHIRVRVPHTQRVDLSAIDGIRACKENARMRLWEIPT